MVRALDRRPKAASYLSEEGLVTSVAVGSLRGLTKSDEEAVDRDELWAVPKNAARAFSNISSGTGFTSFMSDLQIAFRTTQIETTPRVANVSIGRLLYFRIGKCP
jgi:hypothetical protein